MTAIIRGETLTAAALPAGRSGRPEPRVGYLPDAPPRTARQGIDSGPSRRQSDFVGKDVPADLTFSMKILSQPRRLAMHLICLSWPGK